MGTLMDWQTILAIGALALAAFSFLSRTLDKSLSLREHDEYRKGAERTNDGLQREFWREVDRLEQRLNIIEQTRPTAGELKSTADSFKEQLSEMKQQMRENKK